MVSLQNQKDKAKMFELTYKDSYQVERTLKYEDYEALMLALSGCVTLPDTLYVTSLTFEGQEVYQGLVGDLYRFLSHTEFYIKTKIFLSFFLFLLIFSQCFYKIEE